MKVKDTVETFLIHQPITEKTHDQRCKKSRPSLRGIAVTHDRVDAFFFRKELG